MKRQPIWLTLLFLSVFTLTVHAADVKKPAAEPKLTVVNASSHCDWAWVHSRAWHEKRYAETIRQVLMLMRKHPDYVWQLETENEQLAPFLKKADKEWPGLVDEFWQRVREGRIAVIVAISNPRISEVYPETFIRNLVLGKQYFRRHAPGIKQKVYDVVDVMCGHSQIPQMLTQAGYRYFMFSRPVSQQVVFWRKGLDGTRMLSSRNFYCLKPYGTSGSIWKGIKSVPIWRILSNADDMLPDPKLPKEAETWDPKKKILSTTARYFEEVEKYGDQITELDGVLGSLEYYTSCGLHGNHSLFTWNNRNEDLLLCLEKAQVMASTLGGSFPTTQMDRRWHDLLSCTGHAILWIFNADYEERYAKARQTWESGERAVGDALAMVARGIQFQCGIGSPLVVFNFHAWPVTGPVEFTLEGDLAGTVLRDGTGHEIPVQPIEDDGADGRRAVFVADNVPACGYKTFYLGHSDSSKPAKPATQDGLGHIENDHYRVQVKSNGQFEIIDKASGTVLGSPQHGGLGDVVFYDSPNSGHWITNGPLGKRHDWKMQVDKCRCLQGPVFASIRSEGTIGSHKLTREVRLWQASRQIEYLAQIDAQKGSGVFCIRFPLGLSEEQVFAGIPFGAEPRKNFEQEPFRTDSFCKGYPKGYYGTRWTDVSARDFGYTFVCPPGMHTGYSYNRRGEGALEFVLLRLWPQPDKNSKSWAKFCHPSTQGTGHHSWRCALVPHQGTWREAATYRDALEQHVPLLAFSPELGLRRARAGKEKPTAGTQLDEAASFARVMPAGVVLSSLRLVEPVETGKKPEWELRLYETLGKQTDVVVQLGCKVSGVQETNLLGEPSDELGKIDVADNKIQFRIAPWKIATLRITTQPLAALQP